MKTKISSFAMTFFAFSTIFVSHLGKASAAQIQTTDVIFKGADAKTGLGLFKFQLKNKIRDLNMNLKFVSTEKEIVLDIRGMKPTDFKKRLGQEIALNNNCKVIKENEPDQLNALAEYQDCLLHASRADTIVALNKKQYRDWKERVLTEQKLSVAREEMSLQTINADSDTVLILRTLAQDVQTELMSMHAPNSIEIQVVTKSVVTP